MYKIEKEVEECVFLFTKEEAKKFVKSITSLIEREKEESYRKGFEDGSLVSMLKTHLENLRSE